MCVASMSTYSKSGSSSGNILKMRSHSPFCAQRQKRVYTVNHLPNSTGRSRQGAPVRAIHKTASTNSRLSCAVAPGNLTPKPERNRQLQIWYDDTDLLLYC